MSCKYFTVLSMHEQNWNQIKANIYIYIYIYTDYECFLYQYHTYINKSRRYFLQISNISILTNLHIYIHLRKALE